PTRRSRIARSEVQKDRRAVALDPGHGPARTIRLRLPRDAHRRNRGGAVDIARRPNRQGLGRPWTDRRLRLRLDRAAEQERPAARALVDDRRPLLLQQQLLLLLLEWIDRSARVRRRIR